MSRLVSLIGAVVVASISVAGCHSGGPSGDPGDMGEPPMMYQVPSPANHAPAAPTACNSHSSQAAECSPVESR
jgi:hypothetical protein